MFAFGPPATFKTVFLLGHAASSNAGFVRFIEQCSKSFLSILLQVLRNGTFRDPRLLQIASGCTPARCRDLNCRCGPARMFGFRSQSASVPLSNGPTDFTAQPTNRQASEPWLPGLPRMRSGTVCQSNVGSLTKHGHGNLEGCSWPNPPTAFRRRHLG